MKTQKTLFNQAKVNWLKIGQGSPIIFIHGYASSHRMWQEYIHTFAPNFTCYALDLPGHGDSQSMPESWHTLHNYTELLHGFIQENNISQPILVGHSMGSAIAINFSHLYPQSVRGLVLIAPPIVGKFLSYIDPLINHSGILTADRIAKFLTTLGNPSLKQATAKIPAKLHLPNADYIHRIHDDISRTDPKAIKSCLQLLRQLDLQDSLDQQLPPTLIIVGKKDIAVPISQLKFIDQDHPNITIRIIPKAGHQATDTEFDKIKDEIGEFIKNLK